MDGAAAAAVPAATKGARERVGMEAVVAAAVAAVPAATTGAWERAGMEAYEDHISTQRHNRFLLLPQRPAVLAIAPPCCHSYRSRLVQRWGPQ